MSEFEGALPADVCEALIVRPGDTLIMRLRSDVSREQFNALRENTEPMLKERLPGVEVMWLGGVEQIAVYRPDQTEGG